MKFETKLFLISSRVSGGGHTKNSSGDYCVCVCGFTEAPLCTISMVYQGLVHHEAVICTIEVRCTPSHTREGLLFYKRCPKGAVSAPPFSLSAHCGRASQCPGVFIESIICFSYGTQRQLGKPTFDKVIIYDTTSVYDG